MQKQPKNNLRKMVPRWRELARTPSRELFSSDNLRNTEDIDTHFQNALVEWNNKNDISTALKVAEFQMLGATSADSDKAVEYILSNRDIRDEVKTKILKSRQNIFNLEQSNLKNINDDIATLKSKLKNAPKNSILHCEIARLYATAGHRNKAKKHLQIAIKLSPENRYIVRSFVKFFIHDEDADQALNALKFTYNSNDPWLVASSIATSDLADKTQNIPLKRVRALLGSDQNPSQLSELAGAFGTLEIKAGARKRAKKLFLQSSIDPNDNSVAQIIWANENENLEIPFELNKIPMSYEASAYQFDSKEEWAKSLVFCRKWSHDEPFSVRPFTHGSYIAAEYQNNFHLALEFAEKGLISNPHNSTLLNNKAFCYSELAMFNQAKKAIEEAYKHDTEKDAETAIMATRGHIELNSGHWDEGISWYKRAIEDAKEKGQTSSAESAYLHLLKEIMKDGYSIDKTKLEEVDSFFGKDGKATIEGKAKFKSMKESFKNNEYTRKDASNLVSSPTTLTIAK